MSCDSSVNELRQLFEDRDTPDGLQKLGGVSGIAKKLNVDPAKGIQASTASERQQQFGPNRVPERPPTTYLELLMGALQDFTIVMLCFAAVVSIILCVAVEQGAHNCWVEGLAIVLTVLLVSNVAAIQDYQKEQQFRKLNADVEDIQINVVRDGQNTSVSKYDIVVGDIVRLSIGDILEGDGLLIEGYDIETDESALTGEPILIKKSNEKPYMLSGTSVQNGQGTCMVIAVGVNSEKGRIQALVRGQKLGGDEAKEGDEKKEGEEKKEGDDDGDDKEKSLLTLKLEKTATLIGVWAMRIALLSLVGMACSYFIDKAADGATIEGSKVRTAVMDWLITAVTIVVVAVPEGLPLAVTLSLSLSVKKMQKDMCLVKQLDSTETMGSATSICTDKTGTLTQNRMTVMKCYVGESITEGSGGQSCGQTLGSSGTLGGVLCKEVITQGICVNKAEAEIEWSDRTGRWQQKGNKTDCALLAFSFDLGVDYRVVDFKMSTAAKLYPFSSARKRAGIIVPLASGGYRVYVKGASEIVLSLCSSKLDPGTDQVVPLSDDGKRNIIDTVVTPFAKQSLRTICLAYRDVAAASDWDQQLSEDDAVKLTGQKAETFTYETELTFCALVGIEDPLRDTVPGAIAKCNSAGVDVRMVTGDNIDTAVAISKQCGILRPGIDLDKNGDILPNTALSGPDFRKRVLDDNGKIIQDEFDKIWPHLRVLARSSPTDKYVLVSGIIESNLFENEEKCKALGIYPDRQVVAVTGDGTNDAPALKRADVGFVMGITGTSVAKDAADIIIMDDDFASIVQACMWGRNVYDSIAKFLQFQLTVNIVAVSLACLGAFVDAQSPLRAVQMLWVNLIMDSLGALALASEPPVPELLQRPPYGRNRDLVSLTMRFNMFGQAIYQFIILIILVYSSAGKKRPKFCEDGETCDETGINAIVKEYWHCDVRGDLPDSVPDAQKDLYCPQCGGWLDIPSGRGRDANDKPTAHMTLVFNTFVFMQLFNWLNCRKIYHEWNVLSGIQDNRMFMVIWGICVVVQMAIGKKDLELTCDSNNLAFRTSHLNGVQWVVCLGFGIFSMAWQWVLILIAQTYFPNIKKPTVEAMAGHHAGAHPTGSGTLAEAKEELREYSNDPRRRDKRLMKASSKGDLSNPSNSKDNLDQQSAVAVTAEKGPAELKDVVIT